MPTTYTHYAYGQEVFHKLPEELQRKIEPYIEYYNIGVHGPDILFYYEPYHKNRVSAVGYRQHEKSGASFLSPAECKGGTPYETRISKVHPLPAPAHPGPHLAGPRHHPGPRLVFCGPAGRQPGSGGPHEPGGEAGIFSHPGGHRRQGDRDRLSLRQ